MITRPHPCLHVMTWMMMLSVASTAHADYLETDPGTGSCVNLGTDLPAIIGASAGPRTIFVEPDPFGVLVDGMSTIPSGVTITLRPGIMPAGGGACVPSTNFTTLQKDPSTSAHALFEIGEGGLSVQWLELRGDPFQSTPDSGGVVRMNHASASLGLANAVISAGRSDADGGCIYDEAGGTITLSSSSVSDCRADGSGGGIYSHAGSVTYAGPSQSHDCQADVDGGTIYSEGGSVSLFPGALIQDSRANNHGGAIYSALGSVLMNQAVIRRGSAGSRGGGIYNQAGSVTMIDDSQIDDSEATHFGGGIYADGGSTAARNLTNNRTTFHGGGLYLVNGLATIANILSDNQAGLDGGGAYVEGPESQLAVSALVVGNSALQNGGGVRVTQSANLGVFASHFLFNTSVHDGGGIHADAEAVVTDALVSPPPGFEFANFMGNPGPQFEDNRAGYLDLEFMEPGRDGGAIHADNATVVLTGGSDVPIFLRNVATLEGGALAAYRDAVVSISNTVFFVENTAETGSGGGMLATSDATVNLAAVIARENGAGLDGGAVAIEGAAVTMNGLDAEENTAGRDGGALHLDGPGPTSTSLDLPLGIATSNLASTGSGGGFHIGPHGRLTGAIELTQNQARERGGGIDCDGGSASVSSATISFNFLSGDDSVGGGVSVDGGGAFSMTRGTLEENSANTGGGVYVDFGSLLMGTAGCGISNAPCVHLVGNKAPNAGQAGGIAFVGQPPTGKVWHLERVWLQGNTSPDVPGVYVNTPFGSPVFENVVFSQNGTAAPVGSDAALLVETGHITCRHCTIGPNPGTGFEYGPTATFDLLNSVIASNGTDFVPAAPVLPGCSTADPAIVLDSSGVPAMGTDKRSIRNVCSGIAGIVNDLENATRPDPNPAAFPIPTPFDAGAFEVPGECGDQVVDVDAVPPEDCDDGNLDDDDGCNSQCQVPICGNGIVEAPEECDDFNIDNNDDCSADCISQELVRLRLSGASQANTVFEGSCNGNSDVSTGNPPGSDATFWCPPGDPVSLECENAAGVNRISEWWSGSQLETCGGATSCNAEFTMQIGAAPAMIIYCNSQ